MLYGCVTSTCVLANGPTAKQACTRMIALSLADRVGLHINLTELAPLSKPDLVKSLFGEGTREMRGKMGFREGESAQQLLDALFFFF